MKRQCFFSFEQIFLIIFTIKKKALTLLSLLLSFRFFISANKSPPMWAIGKPTPNFGGALGCCFTVWLGSSAMASSELGSAVSVFSSLSFSFSLTISTFSFDSALVSGVVTGEGLVSCFGGDFSCSSVTGISTFGGLSGGRFACFSETGFACFSETGFACKSSTCLDLESDIFRSRLETSAGANKKENLTWWRDI